MIRITDAMNTYNLAIDILYKKDYELFTKKEDEDFILYLKKDNTIQSAQDPLSLLSLVFIIENNIIINEYKTDSFLSNFVSLALDIILKKEFQIIISNEYSDKWYDWVASKKDQIYIAQSPLRLLGLILMIEHFGNDWYSAKVPYNLNDIEER